MTALPEIPFTGKVIVHATEDLSASAITIELEFAGGDSIEFLPPVMVRGFINKNIRPLLREAIEEARAENADGGWEDE